MCPSKTLMRVREEYMVDCEGGFYKFVGNIYTQFLGWS